MKIGPFYIYITRHRMKRRRRNDDIYRNNRQCLLREKHRRWKKNGGRCEECGLPLAEDRLEMHHIIPVSEHPELITKPSNLRMLCHECHLKQHRVPVGQS